MPNFHSTMLPEISDRNGLFKHLRLTSESYEFPHCAMLSRHLSCRIALILYYAHGMNQKKILDSFFELCKYNFENKCQHSLLESSINAWIKNSTVNLHRRREVILSEKVSALQIQFIFAISQVVFDVFCKYLLDSGKKRHIFSMDGRLKRHCNAHLDVLFPSTEVFLPFSSFNHSLFHCLEENNKMSISRTDSLRLLRKLWSEFYFQPDPTQHVRFVHHFHKESEESDSSTDMTNIFTYVVDRSNSDLVLEKHHNSENIKSTQPSLKVHETKPSMQQSAEASQSSRSIILPNNHNSCNTTSVYSEATKPSIDSDLPSAVLEPTTTLNDIIQNYCAMDHTAQHSDDDESSLTSESNSNSSGSWSCNDFNNDSDDHLQSHSSIDNSLAKFNDDSINSDDHHQSSTPKNKSLTKFKDDSINSDDHLRSSTPKNKSLAKFNDDSIISDDHLQSHSSIDKTPAKFNDDSINSDDHLQSSPPKNNFLAKCNATIEWLQSTNCHFNGDADNINFGEALTEDNCMGSPSSRGSLNFVDCSDDEDEYEVIFFDRDTDGHFEIDAFGNMGQGYENPCFEDSFGAFHEPSFIDIVNECWNDDMMELKYKPRKPSKVSFAPEPSLVTVQYFEKTDENTFDVSLVLDNLRFQQRINELGQMLSPFLTVEHRMDVLKRNCFHEG